MKTAQRPFNRPCMQVSSRSRRQHGVVLVVALVMLVIIGLASVAVMRNVMSNDLVSENNRRQGQAMQAAQAALRFCEGELVKNVMTPAAAVDAENDENWNTFSNWTTDGALSSGGPVRVNEAYLNSASQGQSTRYDTDDTSGTTRPQCMAQNRVLADGRSVIVVTARGFSDNFVADPTQSNVTVAGAVVWLQSFIQLAAVEEG
jgi:Tfp pilus assembly protein PilX